MAEAGLRAPEGADDFDPVARFYDWTPVPTHPKRLRPLVAGVDGDVLDLGGGTGRFSVRVFDSRRQRIFMIDPAQKMLLRGRRKKRAVHPVRALGERLPFPDGSFGAVLATEAFHHFAQGQEQVLGEISRVLRGDGVLVIEEPDPTRFFGRLMAWGEKKQKMSSRFRAPGELVGIVERYFQKVDTRRTGWATYCVVGRGTRRV